MCVQEIVSLFGSVIACLTCVLWCNMDISK